jgi:hypothetical protein
MDQLSYRRHRFSPPIIQHAIWRSVQNSPRALTRLAADACGNISRPGAEVASPAREQPPPVATNVSELGQPPPSRPKLNRQGELFSILSYVRRFRHQSCPGALTMIKMPSSVSQTFDEQDEFETAFRAEGCHGLVVTGRGQFRAQLTQIALHFLHLSAAEEQLARVAFMAVPGDMVLLTFPCRFAAGSGRKQERS